MPTSNKFLSLFERKIFFIDSWQENNLLLKESAAVKEILSYQVNWKKLLPCVIDISKVKENRSVIKDKTRLLLSARIKVHGTDGIRGKVSLHIPPKTDPIKYFSKEAKLTPELVKNISSAFCEALLAGRIVKKGGFVLIGEDGRDFYKGKPFKQALIDGICHAGLNVLDAGIVPTPAVPLYAVSKNIRPAIILTASHNPSNQNGVKFFVDGLKTLPEGIFGDHSVTAFLYGTTQGKTGKGSSHRIEKVSTEAKDLFIKTTLENIPDMEALKGLKIVFDPANGAGTKLGEEIIERTGVEALLVNADPRGENINQGGGVALLEGIETFALKDDSTYPASVREMIKNRINYGLVLDGDADRAYLLVLNEQKKAIYVLGGDKTGYLIAKYRKKGLKGKLVYINTVESDIMSNFHIENDLGLTTRIACVGDKWVVQALSKNDVMVAGVEESGHAIIPVRVSKKTVYTGNGILTGLTLLSYIASNKIPLEDICEPYESGYKKTFYTYLVDRKLFQRGSKVFDKDRQIIKKGFEELKKKKIFDGTIKEEVYKDDPDMLYFKVYEKNKAVGAVFARNSGTETKTSVNIRCRIDHKEMMKSVAENAVVFHRKVLKDRANPDTKVEDYVIKALKAGRPVLMPELSRKFKISDINLKALLYGMSKEYFEHKDALTRILA